MRNEISKIADEPPNFDEVSILLIELARSSGGDADWDTSPQIGAGFGLQTERIPPKTPCSLHLHRFYLAVAACVPGRTRRAALGFIVLLVVTVSAATNTPYFLTRKPSWPTFF
jgi:hypothetical protein